MEKKMADKPVERPTFFEIFEARCSESDLGLISLNWFEELSTEAPPYESETSEKTEYRAGWLDQSATKTPRGKPSTYSQLASTPMIFKEQSVTLPLLSSPIKELDQKKMEAGKVNLVNEEHRTSPHVMKTKFDQTNEIFSPLNTSLNVSPAALRDIYRTPQRNIAVRCGRLFCTPKLLEVKTPKCISEGLGAEVDPDMSWSSSLATPPTISATVIIARGNDSISGAKQHDERMTMVLHNFFSCLGKRPEKNDINVLSIPETVNLNTEIDVKDHEPEKKLDGSFSEMNSLEDRFHISIKSDGNKMAQNALEDGEMHEMTIDMPDAGEHVLSVCHTSGKHLLEMKTTNSTTKTCFDKMTSVLLQQSNEVVGNFKDACLRCERELDSPRCELFTTNIPNNKKQKPSENRKFTREDMPSSSSSEWSQLNLSGLDVTQMEKISARDTCSPSSVCSKKRSEGKFALVTKAHANFSTFETSLLNTSSLIEAEKLLNINWSEHIENETKTYEKYSTSETSLMHSVSLSVQDPQLVKGCAAEKVSEVNFLDCSSLMENTNFTEYPEVLNCFHKHLKEHSKSSITDVTALPVICNASTPNNPDGTKWSTNNENTPRRSGLKSMNVLSSLKKRPKRFIYTINTAFPDQEGKVQKEIKTGSSSHSASSHSEFESCTFKGPDTANNNDQDLLVSSAERKYLRSDTEENSMLLSKYATRADKIDNSPNSSFNNRMIYQDLKDILKNNSREHQPASSLDCSEMSNTPKEYLVVSSKNRNVLSVKHKVIATACLLASKHSKMDFGRIKHAVQCPKKDEMDMHTNVNPNNDTVKDQPGEPSSDNEQLVEMEQEPVSMKNCHFNDSLSEINLDISKSNSVCCNKNRSGDENDVTGHLPIDECKPVSLPPLIIQPYKSSSPMLNRERKTDTIPFSKIIAADQETESIEKDENKLQTAANKNTVTIESGKKLFDHKDCGSLQVVISEKSTLPELALKMRPEQIVSGFVIQEPEPNVEDKYCIKKVIKLPSKHVASDKNLYSINPLCLDIKSKENPEDKEKWSGHATFNDRSLNESVGGFQTASNKQIKLSENSITKGKMLFKDMEGECLEDFSRDGIKNISNQITKENVKISPVVDNKLDTNYSHGFDSEASFVEPKNAQSILPESTDSSLQNLPRDQQPQLNRTLTASQEAEITELSNILEETNSQFEFTQFRKRSNMVQNNSSELSGYVDTNETTNLKNISDMWQDADFDDSFETEAQRVNDKSSKHTNTNEESTMVANVKKEREIFQKNNCEVTSTNLCRNANKTPLVPSFSVPTQDSFSNFGGFSSAGGKKINISNEVLMRAAKLFSNLDDDGEMFKSTEMNPRSGYSNKHMTSRWNVSRCLTEKDNYCRESLKDANVEYQNTLKNNEENINIFMQIYKENQGESTKNIVENDCISSSTKISNLKVIKYSRHKMENGLSSSENQNQTLNISKTKINSDTQSQYSLQESLSDLTCLSEVSKTEEILTLNISDETELDLNKNEQKIKNLDFQTASHSNISVSQAPLDKLHLFETCTEKELDNISSDFNREMRNSINMEGIDATSVKKNINVNQNKSKIGSDHQQVSIQQDTDFEIKNIKQNNTTSFHTASGKRVIITDKSLTKAKQIFAEENVFLENKHNSGNFEDSEIQALKKKKYNKDFIKDCELFAEITPKYYQEILNLTGNLVSKELDNPPKNILDDSLIKQPVDVETVKKLSVEVHLSANLDKEPEEHSETSFSKKPVCVAIGKSGLGFYTGNSKTNSPSEASFFEAGKLFAEGNLENSPRKNDRSKSTLIVSANDQIATDLRLKEVPDILAEHPIYINMKNILTVKDNKIKNHSLYLTHRDKRCSFHLKDDSKGSDFEHSNDSSHNVNCFPENMDSVSQDQPLVSLTADKNNLLSSEETFQKESYRNQISDLKFLDANNVLKISASEVAGSNSKFSKDGLVAFSTARGKTVSVSYNALKRVRQMFPENCDKSRKQNTETTSETNQNEIAANCSETLDSAKCPTSANSSNANKNETYNSATCHFPNVNENNYEDEQALQHNRNKSADTGSESNPQMTCFQVNDTFSGLCKSNKLNHHQSDFSTGNYGFFSTASGKPVQLSEDSLKKARSLFSEIENNSSDQQCVSELKCDYDASSVGDQVEKFVGTGSTSALRKSEVAISQEERFSNPKLISNANFGFSTASGKQVLVSENTFLKVKEMFDDTAISKYCFADQFSSRQDPLTALKSSVNYVGVTKVDEASLKPKIQDIHNEELDLTNSCPVEMKPLQNIYNIKTPVCAPHNEKDKHLILLNSFTLSEETQLFEKDHHDLSRMEMEAKAVSCNALTKTKLDAYHLTCSQSSEKYLETEAAESAKAFMEDDKLTDFGVENNTKESLFFCRKKDKNCPLNMRTGKRRMEEKTSLGEPPIKRQLLPEFDRTENPHKSLKASKSTPDGTMKDRRKFMYHIPLKPETCVPFSATKKRQEVKNPNLTIPDQAFKGFKSKSDIFQHHMLRQSLSGTSGVFTPFNKISAEESERRKNLPVLSKTAKTFVPPFKVKTDVSTSEQHGRKRLDSLINKNMNRDQELKDVIIQPNSGETEDYQSEEKDCTNQVMACNLGDGDGDSDLMEMIANLHCARNLQEMRIRKKQKQNIRPQPGSLYLMKTSAAKRISLKAAVEEKSPGTYSIEQLHMYGVSKHCIKVNSINAESFQFLIRDFFSKEYVLAGHGIQLADGGWLIPTDGGKAGKEEFYRALCDTPGVDPKLINEAWVYNHYRWIVWKLAAMEISFPQEFANRCLTPERVLLQLKYRYDLEIDKSQRSAIKKIVEKDDIAAKTLILCVSKIISLSENISDICSNKNMVESKKKAAVIEVTDGWYGVRALLDPPLQALLHGRRLTVGQKIIVHGAELVGSQDACTPLETPDSLMLKISANSTRRARWHAKLGFHQDPRPFPLPLSSLFSEGGTVGCIDVVIQRTYPIQWVEKISAGSYVFRNGRAEEREAAKHAENRQKHLEALFSQIQVEFEQHEDKPQRRALRSRALTRQQIHSLQDGAELYEAIQNASDPGCMEGCLSEEQLKALNTHRQMLNDKKQAQIQAEFKKAIESAEQEEHGCSKRDVSTVWKLRVVDYRRQEKDKAIILTIWRPLLDVCSLLKEGGRYRIYQLVASQSKGKSDTVNVQLTSTNKTQYLQLQASQEVLLQIYIPRKALPFRMLLDPSFQPACAEVDLVGFVVSVSKRTGFTTLVYLSDEDHNLVAIKIWTDLKQLAIEDIINPFTLISASNLQWRSEFKSEIPTLFAGDLSIFSASPKDRYLQERFNKLKNTTENVNCFCNDAERKLMNLLQINDPQPYNLPKEYGLDHHSPSWKSGSDAENKCLISSPNSKIKYQRSLPASKRDLKLVPQGSEQMTPHTSYSEEPPKNCKKRKALDLLCKIPSPPPLTPINLFVSTSLKKAFQPPKSSGVQFNKSLKRINPNSGHINSFKRTNETAPLPENDLVADEELAMINTQVLLYSLPEEKKMDCVDESTSAISSDPSDHLLLKNNSPKSAAETKTSQKSTEGTEAPGKDTRETEGLLVIQKKLQRLTKRKCY
ncbi:breast cancer type 2 susceptibility protein isoform X1 [Gopherus flavomarginatus]|uniref:breast cancer type 2 susceptibility protein isoform X1 n=1 Tax=Gopherus flavomarginatus TaxID=286002 RepID=UPI0021CBE0C8|nr:breast cancer type 2 susceptibility protein isoform X1 [Gopherus flavomarginatus]XP_050793041.1 breast cancer type 2 susceptibility protein isoform X1 [Gopherus flavomarginatus]